VVFHIAAHAIGQDDGGMVKKGAILLARPASSSQQNYGKLEISGLLVMAKADMLTHCYAYGALQNTNSLPCIVRKLS
jgi:hypothetical protein